MFNAQGKPVDLLITDHTYIEGRLIERGTKLEAVPAELAMELAAAGKARLHPGAAASTAKARA